MIMVNHYQLNYVSLQHVVVFPMDPIVLYNGHEPNFFLSISFQIFEYPFGGIHRGIVFVCVGVLKISMKKNDNKGLIKQTKKKKEKNKYLP